MYISMKTEGSINAQSLENMVKKNLAELHIDSRTISRIWLSVDPIEIVVNENNQEPHIHLLKNKEARDVIVYITSTTDGLNLIQFKLVDIGMDAWTLEHINTTKILSKIGIDGITAVSVLEASICSFKNLVEEFPDVSDKDWKPALHNRTTLASVFNNTREKKLVPILQVTEESELIHLLLNNRHIIPKHLLPTLFGNVDVTNLPWYFYSMDSNFTEPLLEPFFTSSSLKEYMKENIALGVDLLISNTEGLKDYTYLQVSKHQKLPEQDIDVVTCSLYFYKNAVCEEFEEIYSSLAQMLEDKNFDFKDFVEKCNGKLVIEYISREKEQVPPYKMKNYTVRFELLKDIEKELEVYKSLAIQFEKGE